MCPENSPHLFAVEARTGMTKQRQSADAGSGAMLANTPTLLLNF